MDVLITNSHLYICTCIHNGSGFVFPAQVVMFLNPLFLPPSLVYLLGSGEKHINFQYYPGPELPFTVVPVFQWKVLSNNDQRWLPQGIDLPIVLDQ